eukprot:1897410-Lingulodinium_polyedra.AAC.1
MSVSDEWAVFWALSQQQQQQEQQYFKQQRQQQEQQPRVTGDVLSRPLHNQPPSDENKGHTKQRRQNVTGDSK